MTNVDEKTHAHSARSGFLACCSCCSFLSVKVCVVLSGSGASISGSGEASLRPLRRCQNIQCLGQVIFAAFYVHTESTAQSTFYLVRFLHSVECRLWAHLCGYSGSRLFRTPPGTLLPPGLIQTSSTAGVIGCCVRTKHTVVWLHLASKHCLFPRQSSPPTSGRQILVSNLASCS